MKTPTDIERINYACPVERVRKPQRDWQDVVVEWAVIIVALVVAVLSWLRVIAL